MKRVFLLLVLIMAGGVGFVSAVSMGWIKNEQISLWTSQAQAIVFENQTDTQTPSQVKPTPDQIESVEKSEPTVAETATANAPAITVASVSERDFVAKRLLTGSLVAREDILLSPEVDNIRIISINAEEGDVVKKGQELAALQDAKIQSELAQNTASLNRLDAEARQLQNQLVEAEAVLDEAQKALDRAKPLKSSGYLSESVFDQRRTAVLTTRARTASARDGLELIKARKAEMQAQRRDIEWRLSKTLVRAPADGLIFQRNARVGQLIAPGAGPMFRIAEDGDIELEADVEDFRMAELEPGQRTRLSTAGGMSREGVVRLVSSSVDTATRLGKVRIAIDNDTDLQVGAFARAEVEIAKSRGLAIPASALLYGPAGPRVLRVVSDHVVATPVTVGLTADAFTEVISGLNRGDIVVVKAGTFLRDGDAVRPVSPAPKLSEVTR
ncbi:MAG: efflux RND transporter periplasmic adaptor subunit [Pseudomonadota bacterium]